MITVTTRTPVTANDLAPTELGGFLAAGMRPRHIAKIYGVAPRVIHNQIARFNLKRNRQDAGAPRFACTSPDGVVHHVANLAVFCAEHDLNAGMMSKLTRLPTNRHRGWSCSLIEGTTQRRGRPRKSAG